LTTGGEKKASPGVRGHMWWAAVQTKEKTQKTEHKKNKKEGSISLPLQPRKTEAAVSPGGTLKKQKARKRRAAVPAFVPPRNWGEHRPGGGVNPKERFKKKRTN